jgi:EmrB/QacA subfamily drug resistance transporter
MGDSRVKTAEPGAADRLTRRGVLFISLAASFLTPFMVSSVNIALPTIARDLSMGVVAMSWVTVAYLLCSTIFLIPFGKLADTFGRKRFFAAGAFLITVSSLLSVVAHNGAMLIASRMLHGTGAAMIFGTGMAMLTSVVPPAKRGRIIGINVSFTYLGLMLGPFIGGFLTHHFGWRAIFFVNIPAGAVIALAALSLVRREWREHKGQVVDITGMVLYAVSIALIIIGFSKLTQWYGMLSAGIGIVTGALFLIAESRSGNSILPITLLLRNRVFACSNLAALINYGATYSIGFLLSCYLQYVKGLSPQQAGTFLMVQPIAMVLFSPLAGRLSDRIEPRILSSAGMGCITVALLLLSRFGASTTTLSVITTQALFGIGFALFSSPNTSAVMGSVETSNYGIASATVGTMRLLGQVFSMGFTTLLMSVMIGEGTIIPQLYPQFLVMMHLTCQLFAGLCFLGIGVSLVRGEVHRSGIEAVKN